METGHRPGTAAGLPSPRRAAAALSLAHGVNDLYMGFLPGLLPLLADKLSLSLTRVGATVTLIGLVSNLLQPLFGHLGDRVGRRTLAAAGPAVTAVAMSCVGLVDSYQALLLALVIGGIGNATFHPVAASLAGSTGKGRSTAMAVFVGGGNIGYGCGPLAAIFLARVLGLGHMWVAAGLGLAVAMFVLASVDLGQSRPRQPREAPVAGGPGRWVGPLLLLYLVVMLRAGAATVFTTFVPLLCERRGEPLALGGFTLLGFSLAGAAGGLGGGLAVRRWEERWVTALSLAGAGACLAGFLAARGMGAAVLALAMGVLLFAALPVNIAMAQRLLPHHATAVSGLVMGTAWAVGSFSATGVGVLADALGAHLSPAAALGRAMAWSVLLPLAASGFAWALPLRGRGGETGPATG